MFNIIFYVHGYFFPASHLFLCFFGWYLFKHQSDGFNGFLCWKSPMFYTTSSCCSMSVHTKTKTLCWNMVLIFLCKIKSIMQTAFFQQKDNFHAFIDTCVFVRFVWGIRPIKKVILAFGTFLGQKFCFTGSLFSAHRGICQTKESTIVMALLAIVCITSEFGQVFFVELARKW